LGAVLGFKSRVVAVFALLEPAQMFPLLEGQLASPQELQKIHRFTMPQHRQDLVIKQAHIKDEQARQE